jgi:carbamate kinase
MRCSAEGNPSTWRRSGAIWRALIGPVSAAEQALAKERGWTFAADGAWQRRVAPSPERRDIVEIETIRLLVRYRMLIAAVGGGGIPDATPIRHATPSELRGFDFAPGSMGLKVEAACCFVEASGSLAGIGA